MRLKHLCFSFCFWIFSCSSPSPLTNSSQQKPYQNPNCHGGASPEDLERKKEEMFRIIRNSNQYASENLKNKAILNYENRLSIQQSALCPQDVERMIDNIIRIHKG